MDWGEIAIAHKKHRGVIDEYNASRTAAGRQIDPQTAEVTWWHGNIDPYGMEANLPSEDYCYGELYFARAPSSDVWVWFGDLPDATCEELKRRIDAGIAN